MPSNGNQKLPPPGGSREDMTPVQLGLSASPLPELPLIAPRLPLPEPPIPVVPEPAREYIRPAYAERFLCINSACEDTCCKGWGVPIDQGTWEKYRSNDLLKPHLGTTIILNPNVSSVSDYARFQMKADSTCPFFGPEQLCGIQKHLGAEMLPTTCSVYPRAVRTNSGQVEWALNLSCPEAARLVLLDTNLIEDGNWRASTGARYAGALHSTRQPKDSAPAGFDPQLAVREFVLLLLADRSYPLWQRLILLGTLGRRLHALAAGARLTDWVQDHAAPVAQLLADSARSATQGTLRPIMDVIEPQPDLQLQTIMELLRLRLCEQPIPERFLQCVQEFELGLGCATAKSERQILQAYTEGYRRYYLPLMEQHPHLLENYLANHVFKNTYPFGLKASAKTEPALAAGTEHLSLCVHTGLIQTLLIGMAAHHREAFDCGHVVKLIQSMARTIEHSQRFLDQIAVFVQERDLNHPRGIALLVRPPA